MQRAGWCAVVALIAVWACRSAPAPRPLADATPDAGVEPFDAGPPPAQTGRVIGEASGTAVVALDAPTFEALPREQRAVAYGLAQAAAAGAAPALDQSYRYNLDLARLLRGILSRPAVVPAPLLGLIRAYARAFWINGGAHDAESGVKLLPGFTLAQLRTAALAAQAAGAQLGLRAGRLELGLRALEGPLFDPRIDPLRLARPAKGQDALLASAGNLYEGVALRDLDGFAERAPRATRLVREAGNVVERPVDVTRVAEALEQLPQRPEMLIGFLRSGGDPERFRAVERMWVTAPGAIDSAFGFFDFNVDPRGKKGLFGAVLGLADPAPAPVVDVATLAAQLGGPVPPPTTLSPLVLIAAGGSLRPLRTGALTLGEGPRRTMIFPAAMLAAQQAAGDAIVRELAPPELARDFVRCAGQVRVAQAALRELFTARGALATLGLDGPAAAEVRADAAAHAVAQEAPVRALFRDARCQELYPQLVAAQWLLGAADAPENGHLDAHGLRAQQLERYWFLARGALSEGRDGTRRFVRADPARFAEAAFELVKLLDQVEKDRNAQRLSELFEQHGSQVDLAWRDELFERFRDKPRRTVVVPPRLEPVMEDGRVVDAHAVQIDDLDAEVLRSLNSL